MRVFIIFSFSLLFISFSVTSKAYNLPSEEISKVILSKKNSSTSNSDIIFDENTESDKKAVKQITRKEKREYRRQQKKIAKQSRKEFRKAIWKTIKEQHKINKANKDNEEKGETSGKKTKRKIHWAAYLSFFSALGGIGLIAAAIILETVGVLVPFLIIGLLLLSVITAVVGISAVASDETSLYHKSHTITLALIGGITALLALLIIGFVVVAVSALSY